MPRKAKYVSDIRAFARQHTDLSVRTLAGIAASPKAAPAARVAAAQALLDRGWGKPSQPITGKDEEPLEQREMSNLELAQWIGTILREVGQKTE